MKTLNELAKKAYEAYGQTTDFKNYQGLPMPKYEELPPTIQAAWRSAAQAVWFTASNVFERSTSLLLKELGLCLETDSALKGLDDETTKEGKTK